MGSVCTLVSRKTMGMFQSTPVKKDDYALLPTVQISPINSCKSSPDTTVSFISIPPQSPIADLPIYGQLNLSSSLEESKVEVFNLVVEETMGTSIGPIFHSRKRSIPDSLVQDTPQNITPDSPVFFGMPRIIPETPKAKRFLNFDI